MTVCDVHKHETELLSGTIDMRCSSVSVYSKVMHSAVILLMRPVFGSCLLCVDERASEGEVALGFVHMTKFM